ncbi:MAG: hypothetical protein V4501_08255 [Pseudomonadota bacterium]
MKKVTEFPIQISGAAELWEWFSLSYAGWLTLPRIMMHEMPDEWQGKMAELLTEWDATWNTEALPGTRVQAVTEKGKITKFPTWLLNYRHPNKEALQAIKIGGEL